MTQQRSPDSGRIDYLYSLRANRHRRATLQYFRESSSDVASLDDIVEATSVSGDEKYARTQLHHYALPRLDAADVVDYDARSTTIRYRGHPDWDALKRDVAQL